MQTYMQTTTQTQVERRGLLGVYLNRGRGRFSRPAGAALLMVASKMHSCQGISKDIEGMREGRLQYIWQGRSGWWVGWKAGHEPARLARIGCLFAQLARLGTRSLCLNISCRNEMGHRTLLVDQQGRHRCVGREGSSLGVGGCPCRACICMLFECSLGGEWVGGPHLTCLGLGGGVDLFTSRGDTFFLFGPRGDEKE